MRRYAMVAHKSAWTTHWVREKFGIWSCELDETGGIVRRAAGLGALREFRLCEGKGQCR